MRWCMDTDILSGLNTFIFPSLFFLLPFFSLFLIRPFPRECTALKFIFKLPFFTIAVPQRHVSPNTLQMLVIAEFRCVLFLNQTSHVGRATLFLHVFFEF